MPRQARAAPGGLIHRVLNRAVARLPLLQKPEDYTAFECVLAEAWQRCPIRLLAYCPMPNHWHMVLWPREAGELTAFVRWLTHPHTMRWHTHYHTAGTGHLYQGPFKLFPVRSGAFPDRLPLPRAARPAGQPGRAGGGCAVVQPVAGQAASVGLNSRGCKPLLQTK